MDILILLFIQYVEKSMGWGGGVGKWIFYFVVQTWIAILMCYAEYMILYQDIPSQSIIA